MADYVAPGIGGKGGMVIGVIWAENLLTFGLISLRVYTRKFIKGKVGWDDICLIITWVLMVAFAIFITIAGVHGMGQHFDDLELSQFSRAVLMLLCSQFIVSLAIGMGKVVVAVFLLRIVTEKWHKWFLWFCIFSMMFLSCLLSVVLFAQCTPTQSIWDPALADQKVCHISLTVVAFITCSYAAALDFLLAGFPWLALRNLNMKRKERITICVSLSLGIFAGVCGVIRTSGLEVLANSADYLYATSDSVIWTASEVTTTIVCVCIPTLRPLYNRMRGQESSSAGYQQHDDSGYKGGSNSYPLGSFPGNRSKVGKNNFSNVEATQKTKNDSDETILLQGGKENGNNNNNNIIRVQEVSITYEQSGQAV